MDDYYDPYFWDDPFYPDVPIMQPSAMPEPKPTFYNNVQFKSRLEARWAVLFDALGLRWEYEAVKFKFSPQNWEYTPDFCITLAPSLGPAMLLEVKPAVPEAGIFRAMETIEEQSKEFQTAIGVGSYYKTQYPRIYQSAKISTSLTEWLISNLGQTRGKAMRAMQAATGYRFDLR